MFNRPMIGMPQRPLLQAPRPVKPVQPVKPSGGMMTQRPSPPVNALRPVPIRRGF